MKRFTLLCMAALLCLLMGGCALFPQEETFAKAPVAPQEDALPYTFATVERGDLELTQSIYCVYGSVRQQSLSFPMDGSRIDAVYVETGDAVSQGQLMASVNLEAVYERLAQMEQEQQKLALQLRYVDRYEELARARAAIQHAEDPAARAAALSELSAQYEKQRVSLRDQQTCLTLEMDECNAKIAQGELHAPFDGTVTYARASTENTLTNKDYTMFTIVDSTRSLFSAETAYWASFQPGDQVQVVMIGDEATYPATVVDETELGDAPVEKKPGEKAMVYFELNEPVYSLEYDDHANVMLTVDSRKDVLLLNTRALVDRGDEKLVYYIDPTDGLKKYKVVTIGLVASMRAEILSGLSEGEQVILK